MQDELDSECGYQDFGVFNNIYHAISSKQPLRYRATFCGSQIGVYLFDPLYKIYPCWDVVGEKKYIIGDFRSGEIKWDIPQRSKWNSSDVTSVKKCSTCKFALLCGGGCVANSPNHHCTQMPDIIKYATKRAYASLNI
jgi:uncharacterized protein